MNEKWHFWYSEQAEIQGYTSYAWGLEFGSLRTWDIPVWNTCLISIGDESAVIHYNLCADSMDAYRELTWGDLVYLGAGKIASCRQMTHEEVRHRVQELNMIIPSVLKK